MTCWKNTVPPFRVCPSCRTHILDIHARMHTHAQQPTQSCGILSFSRPSPVVYAAQTIYLLKKRETEGRASPPQLKALPRSPPQVLQVFLDIARQQMIPNGKKQTAHNTPQGSQL